MGLAKGLYKPGAKIVAMDNGGLCDVPRIGMHMYISVQTRRGNFVIISSVKTQLIEKHKNLGRYQAYIWFKLVIYHCCL
jgi:hypothetical protein